MLSLLRSGSAPLGRDRPVSNHHQHGNFIIVGQWVSTYNQVRGLLVINIIVSTVGGPWPVAFLTGIGL